MPLVHASAAATVVDRKQSKRNRSAQNLSTPLRRHVVHIVIQVLPQCRHLSPQTREVMKETVAQEVILSEPLMGLAAPTHHHTRCTPGHPGTRSPTQRQGFSFTNSMTADTLVPSPSHETRRLRSYKCPDTQNTTYAQRHTGTHRDHARPDPATSPPRAPGLPHAPRHARAMCPNIPDRVPDRASGTRQGIGYPTGHRAPDRARHDFGHAAIVYLFNCL